MCGICFILRRKNKSNNADASGVNCDNDDDDHFNFLPINRRGPDTNRTTTIAATSEISYLCHAAVLSLQRNHSCGADKNNNNNSSSSNKSAAVPMPVSNGASSHFLWNGEIFCAAATTPSLSNNSSSSTCGRASDTHHSSVCDTQYMADTIFSLEEQASKRNNSTLSDAQRVHLFAQSVCRFARGIGGPFSFVYVAGTHVHEPADNDNTTGDIPAETSSNHGAASSFSSSSSASSLLLHRVQPPLVIFCRDSWGRRSLLWGQDPRSGTVVLSSTILPKKTSTETQHQQQQQTLNNAAAAVIRSGLPKHMFVSEESLSDDLESAAIVGYESAKGDEEVSSDVRRDNDNDNESGSDPLTTSLTDIPSWTEIPPDGVYAIVSSSSSSSTSSSSSCASFQLVAKYSDCLLPCSGAARGRERTAISISSSSTSSVRLHPLSLAARFKHHRAHIPLSSAQAAREQQLQQQQRQGCRSSHCVHDSFLELIREVHRQDLLASLVSSRASNATGGGDIRAASNKIARCISLVTNWIVDVTHWGSHSAKQELLDAMEKKLTPFITANILQQRSATSIVSGSNMNNNNNNNNNGSGSISVIFTCSFVYMIFLAVSVQRRIARWNTHSAPSSSSSLHEVSDTSTSVPSLASSPPATAILIPFSGGVDCSVLAVLAAVLRGGGRGGEKEEEEEEDDVEFDFVNVSFGFDARDCMSSIDRIAAMESASAIAALLHSASCRGGGGQEQRSQPKVRLLLADVSGNQIAPCGTGGRTAATSVAADIALHVLPRSTVMDVCIGAAMWFAASGRGRLANFLDPMSVVATAPPTTTTATVSKEGAPTNHNDDDDENDDGVNSSGPSDATRRDFQPLLACLIRHYVDRGLEEMSLCLLGKEYTSDELVAVNKRRGFKSLRAQVEEAQRLGLVRMRGVSRKMVVVPSSAPPPATTAPPNMAPCVRDRVAAAASETKSNDIDEKKEEQQRQQQVQIQQTKKRNVNAASIIPAHLQSMKDYLISIACPDAAAAARKQRQLRLYQGGLREQEQQQQRDGNNAPTKDDNATRSICSTSPAAVLVEVTESHTSTARIVLAGMGADESLGGYARYTRQQQRTTIIRDSVSTGAAAAASAAAPEATNQMQLDFDRLWLRNLGRDDRCIAASGREGRFPFLDECLLFSLSGIVSWVEEVEEEQQQRQQQEQQLIRDDLKSVAYRDDPILLSQQLFKDKKILRFGASMLLGLPDCVAFRPKKAIQFGTKIADRKNSGETVLLL